jgi:hypothetical protein
MSHREALRELVEAMTDEEVEALWVRIQGEVVPSAAVLDLRESPVLREIWDNDEDAIYDALDEG